jgi:hypothetical protein
VVDAFSFSRRQVQSRNRSQYTARCERQNANLQSLRVLKPAQPEGSGSVTVTSPCCRDELAGLGSILFHKVELIEVAPISRDGRIDGSYFFSIQSAMLTSTHTVGVQHPTRTI